MNAAKLLHAVRNAGLTVSLGNDGLLLVRGNREVLACWRETLRKHKVAIQAELLAEHARDLEAALACVMPREKAQAEAQAATGLLARNTGCPWAALRRALQDASLPDTPEPVDRPPYGPPAWCIAPKTRKPIRQGRIHPQPQP